jgi:hypothetical protein
VFCQPSSLFSLSSGQAEVKKAKDHTYNNKYCSSAGNEKAVGIIL